MNFKDIILAIVCVIASIRSFRLAHAGVVGRKLENYSWMVKSLKLPKLYTGRKAIWSGAGNLLIGIGWLFLAAYFFLAGVLTIWVGYS